MISSIIILLLIAFAAVFKALADTVAFHKGGRFKGRKFFDINQQGRFLPLTKYPLDAWHLANSAMIVCFIAAAFIGSGWFVIKVVIAGLVFNVVFNIFWNKIFK